MSGTTSCTRCGMFWSSLWLLSAILIVVGALCNAQKEPNGELKQWYSVPTCLQNNSFSVAGQGTFDVYSMRSVEGWAPGQECPIVPSEEDAPMINITLEQDDGWRSGSTYKPIFLLPDDSYVLLSFEIVDAQGNELLPASTYSLGPDAAYPYTAPTDQITLVDRLGFRIPPPPSAPRPPSAPAANATNDTLANATNATLAPPPTSGRRLLFGDGGGAAAEAAVGAAFSVAEAPYTAALVTSPRRQLLKGGTSGVAGGGGRSSTVGRGAWGTSTPTRVSYTSRSSTSIHHGHVYGGRGVYLVGGRHYGGGHAHPYSYYYGRNAIMLGTMLYVVGPSGYGCYSCRGYARTCSACTNCYSRYSCGGSSSIMTASALDRYELERLVALPTDGAAWPLTLRVHNVTQFVKATGTPKRSLALYANFFTSDGDVVGSIGGATWAIGWIGVVFFSLVIACNRRALFPDKPGRNTGSVKPTGVGAGGVGGGVGGVGGVGGHARARTAPGGGAAQGMQMGSAYPHSSTFCGASFDGTSVAQGVPIAQSQLGGCAGLPLAYPTAAYGKSD